MTHVPIHPSSAQPWERLTGEVTDLYAALLAEYDGIRVADETPPPQFLPFLVAEYGLGELTPYVPNLYQLIDQGVRWQRIRGTPAAVARGLEWIGYAATIEEEPVRRRKWNRFQLELARVRDAEDPDLERVEGVTQLSVPIRSRFYRGFRGYDVRAAELSWSRLSNCLLSQHSGARIGGRAKWSFGRAYEHEQLLSVADLFALGVWLPPVGARTPWGSINVAWGTIDEPWGTPLQATRRATIYAGLEAKTAYIRFRDQAGDVIGSVRPVVHGVKAAASGAYEIAGVTWAVDTRDPSHMLVRGLTPFGAGYGHTAATAEVVIDGALAAGVPAGRQWLEPEDLTGGRVVASFEAPIEFGRTVRERVSFLLALDGDYSAGTDQRNYVGTGSGTLFGSAPGRVLGTWSL